MNEILKDYSTFIATFIAPPLGDLRSDVVPPLGVGRGLLHAVSDALDNYVVCNCGDECEDTCTYAHLAREFVMILNAAGLKSHWCHHCAKPWDMEQLASHVVEFSDDPEWATCTGKGATTHMTEREWALRLGGIQCYHCLAWTTDDYVVMDYQGQYQRSWGGTSAE